MIVPITITISTPGEVFAATITESRELSTKILTLSDLEKSPLAPGETADARRHQIAKLGKRLAELFLLLDNLMRQIGDAHMKAIGIDEDEAKPEEATKSDPNMN